MRGDKQQERGQEGLEQAHRIALGARIGLGSAIGIGRGRCRLRLLDEFHLHAAFGQRLQGRHLSFQRGDAGFRIGHGRFRLLADRLLELFDLREQRLEQIELAGALRAHQGLVGNFGYAIGATHRLIRTGSCTGG